MHRKLCTCFVSSDLNTKIVSHDHIIYEDSLRAALAYADDNQLMLDIIFDYNAAYIYSKKVPENLKSKDREYWEIYHSKNLLMSNELTYTYRINTCTVWLAAGDIKDMIYAFADIIHAISWKALILLKHLSILDLKTGLYLYYDKDTNQYICLGVIDKQLITCRAFHPNRHTLFSDILETSVYLKQFTNDSKYLIKIIVEESEQIITETCIDNWIYIEHIDPTMHPTFDRNLLSLELAQSNIFEYLYNTYSDIFIKKTADYCKLTDLKIQIDKDTNIPFIQSGIKNIYVYIGMSISVFACIFLQLNIKQYNHQVTQYYSERQTITQSMQSMFVNTTVPTYAHVSRINDMLSRRKTEQQYLMHIISIFDQLKPIITSVQYMQNKTTIVMKIKKPRTYQDTIDFTQHLQEEFMKITNSNNINITSTLEGMLLKYTVVIYYK